jgi:hypothetical protein
MPVPVIQQVDNTPADGLHLDVTMQAAPFGPITFKVSQLPGVPGSLTTFTTIDSTHYRVYVPPPNGALTPMSLRRFIYVTAYDGITEANEQEGEWLAPDTNEDWMHLTEKAVHQIMMDNVKALDRGLQIRMSRRTWDDGSPVRVEKLITGLPEFELEGKNPALSIRCTQESEDLYFGFPYTDMVPISGTMVAYIFHSGAVTHEHLARALAHAAKDIFNQKQYLEYQLVANGLDSLRLTEFHTSVIRSNESPYPDEGCFLAQADMDWSAKMSVGKA